MPALPVRNTGSGIARVGRLVCSIAPLTAVLLLAQLSPGCASREHPPPADSTKTTPSALQQSAPMPETRLSDYSLNDPNPLTFRLPEYLNEISGLAMTADGRLFGHDDESPVVYQIDYRSGAIVKRFTIGSGFLEEDFEGIAIVGSAFFLMSSNGNLFEFNETGDRGHVDFVLHKTFLSKRNDLEGLDYDPATDCLLLACKGDPGKGYDGDKAVYEFSMKTKSLSKEPRFLLASGKLKRGAQGRKFNPSGLAVQPVTGHIFIISADGESIAEVDRDGTILDQTDIPKKTNRQPEGIAFAPDGSLILANDIKGGHGTLVLYPPEKQ